MKIIRRLSRFLVLYASAIFCAETSPASDEGERITALLNASQAVIVKNNALPIDPTVKAPPKKHIRKKKKSKKKHVSKSPDALNSKTALINVSQASVSNNKSPSIAPEPLVAIPIVERRPEKRVNEKSEDKKTEELNRDDNKDNFVSRVSKGVYDFSGFYVGVSSGYNQIYNKVTETFANLTSDSTKQEYYLNGRVNRSTQSARGIFGGGFLGFGKQFSQYYLGVQFEGNLQNSTSKQNSGNSSSGYNLGARNLSISLKNNLALSLKTGIASGKSLVYAKVGASYAKFQMNSEYPFIASFIGIGGNQYFNKRLIGLSLGTGVDVPVTRNVILSGEVGYTQYQKFSIAHTSVSTTDITPSALSFQVKASYKF